MSVHPTKREAFEAMVNFLHTPLFEVRVRQIVAQILAEQATALASATGEPEAKP